MIQNDRSVPVATVDVNAVVSDGVGVVLSESVDAWLRFWDWSLVTNKKQKQTNYQGGKVCGIQIKKNSDN